MQVGDTKVSRLGERVTVVGINKAEGIVRILYEHGEIEEVCEKSYDRGNMRSKRGPKLLTLCKRAGVSSADISKYKAYIKGEELSNSELIASYKQFKANGGTMEVKRETLTGICNKYGLNISTVSSYRSKHKGLSYEESALRVKEIKERRERYEETIEEKCKRYGLARSSVTSYKKLHRIEDWDEAIRLYKGYRDSKEKIRDRQLRADKAIREMRYYKQEEQEGREGLNKDKTLKDKCEQLGLNYQSVKRIKDKVGLSDEDAIKERIMVLTLDKICEHYNLQLSEVRNYKRNHPRMMYEDVIRIVGKRYDKDIRRIDIDNYIGL